MPIKLALSTFCSVSDLLDYIAPDADVKAREAQKKLARVKLVIPDCCIYITFLVLTQSSSAQASHFYL